MYTVETTKQFDKSFKRCLKNYLPNIVRISLAVDSPVYGNAISKATGF